MEYFISAAVIIMETFCCFQAFGSLLKPKNRLYVRVSSTALAVASFLVMNIFHLQGIYKICFLLVAFYLALLFAFEGSAISKLFTAIVTYVLFILVNYAVAFILMLVTGDDYAGIRADPLFFVFGAIITEVFFFMVVVFIRRVLLKKHDESGLKTFQWFGLLLFPLVSLYTIYLLMLSAISSGETSFTILIDAVGLMLINIALFYFVENLSNGFLVEKENQALKIQAYNEMKKTEALEEVFVEQRKQTHEFKNHLTAIQGLLEANDICSALEYVETVKGDVYLGDPIINTGNAAVDKVINQYYHLSNVLGISMDFVVGEKITIPIPIEEFIIIISNVLDNAVKASKDSDKKSITVKLIEEEGLLFAVKNSVNGEVVIENNQVVNDINSLEHGYGLKNVSSIIEKYGFYYAIDYNDGWFVFSSIFNNFNT